MITFDKLVTQFILSVAGYSTDSDGFVIQEKSGKRVLATDGKQIKATEVAIIAEDGIFRSDLPSLLQLSDHIK